MNIKHAIVIKTDTEPMKVKVTEMEKPGYRATASEAECDEYKKNYDLWEKSFVEYPVFDEEYFEELSQYNYLGNLGHLHPDWYDDIKVGIEIKIDNIAIENRCVQTGKPCGYPCNGQENCDKSKYAVFAIKNVDDVKKNVDTDVFISLDQLLLRLSRNKDIGLECFVKDENLSLTILTRKDPRLLSDEIKSLIYDMDRVKANRVIGDFNIDLNKPIIRVDDFKPYF